jgi:hypothetical protein
LDLAKPLWKLVPCVEVTLMSKFHPIWCLIAQESKLRRMFPARPDISGNLPDISAETRHIRSKARHVHWIFSAVTFDDRFGHILLTGCPIDPIFSVAFVTLRGPFVCC